MTNLLELIAELEQFMKECGLTPPPGVVRPTGQIVRFTAEEHQHRKEKKSDWIFCIDFLLPSGEPLLHATFGSWFSSFKGGGGGGPHKYNSKKRDINAVRYNSHGKKSGRSLTPQEWEEREKFVNRVRHQADTREKEDFHRKQKWAKELWDGGDDAKESLLSHAYIQKKQITPYGARVTNNTRSKHKEILVPMNTTRQSLYAIQRIWVEEKGGETEKRFTGTMRGAHLLLGNFSEGCDLYMVEGWATGCTVWEALGKRKDSCVLICFDCGNMTHAFKEVVVSSRPKPGKVFVCQDLDKAGETAAMEVAKWAYLSDLPCSVRKPPQTDKTGYDFNDLRCDKGLQAVKLALNTEVETVTEELQSEEVDAGAEVEAEMPKLEHRGKPLPTFFPLEEFSDDDDIEPPPGCLGNNLEEVVDMISSYLQTPKSMIVGTMLGMISFSTAALVDIVSKGAPAPTSLYFLLGAEPSSGKSGAFEMLSRGIRLSILEEEARNKDEWMIHEENLDTWKKMVDELRKEKKEEKEPEKIGAISQKILELKRNKPNPPKSPNARLADVTTDGMLEELNNRHFVGIVSDEGGTLLGGYAMRPENIRRTAATLCGLFSGGEIDISRKEKSFHMKNKRLSINLSLQTEGLKDFLNKEELRESGLVARFCVSFPPDKMGSRVYGTGKTTKESARLLEPSNDLSHYFRKTQELGDENPYLRYLKRTKELADYAEKSAKEDIGKWKASAPILMIVEQETEEALNKFRNEIEGTIAPGEKNETMKTDAARIAEISTRLGSLLQVYYESDFKELFKSKQNLPLRINLKRKYLEMGYLLSNYFFNHKKKVLKSPRIRKRVTEMHRLSDILFEKGGKSKSIPLSEAAIFSELDGTFTSYQFPDFMKGCLQDLEGRGYVLRREEEHEGVKVCFWGLREEAIAVKTMREAIRTRKKTQRESELEIAKTPPNGYSKQPEGVVKSGVKAPVTPISTQVEAQFTPSEDEENQKDLAVLDELS